MEQAIRPGGREAGARKYDILSALMAYALAGDAQRQRLVMRLMALITARYNWPRNELTTGQREIARLWSVDERTVKRDMARLRALGWVTVKRQGARGRVSVLGLDLDRMMLDTRAAWAHIGPDFIARVGGAMEPAATGPGAADGDASGGGQGGSVVVPFRRAAPAAIGDGPWQKARARLEAEDPALFRAWFAPLTEAGLQDGTISLCAPSRFHATYLRTHLLDRLRRAVTRADPTVHGVTLIVL